MDAASLDFLKRKFLGELAQRPSGSARLPRIWSSVKVYRALVEDGTAQEVSCDNILMLAFEITADGRAAVAARPDDHKSMLPART